MKLSPIPWLSSIGNSMFQFFGSDEQERAEKQREEDIKRHTQTLREAEDLDRIQGTDGYALLCGMIEDRIEGHRQALEKTGNIPILRARIEELRAVLKMVPDGVDRAEEARKMLLELEAKNG